MNNAQVLEAWRQHRLLTDRENDARRLAAREYVARHAVLCDERGVPCPFAVDAALHYHRLGGSFDVDVVRRHRDMKVARIIERLGEAA